MLTGPRHGGSSDVMALQMSSPPGFSHIAVMISILVLVLALLPPGVNAHAPSGVLPAFDEGSRVLSVSITHPVANPSTHYISRVLVTAGDTVVSDTRYTIQPTSQPFTYTYPVPPGVKGEIRVTAECSITGSQSATLQVPEGDPAGTPLPGLTTPATAAATPPRPPGPPPGTSSTLPPATPPATTGAGPGPLPVVAALALALAGWRLRR